MTGRVPEVRTRKPTGIPPWPILLLAGAEKTGKTYQAAQAAASDLIGQTWWVTFGEDQPDEYKAIADFDIVEHDGSYRDLLAQLRAIAFQPLPSAGAPLLVIDSMTRLWNHLSDEAQDTANRRAHDKAERARRPVTADDATITTDLWNSAARRWSQVMDAVRAFPGPVVLTARLDVVAVMDKGEPTKEKTFKVQAHKSLPYDVGAVVQMPQLGETWVTGVRSLRLKLAARQSAPDFTVDWLWRQLGVAGQPAVRREHAAPRFEGDQPAYQEAQAPRRPDPTTFDPHVAEVWLEEVRQAELHEDPREALLSVWRRCGNTGNLQRPAWAPQGSSSPVRTLDSVIREAAEHAIERMERMAAEAEHAAMALDEAPPAPQEPAYDDYDETPF